MNSDIVRIPNPRRRTPGFTLVEAVRQLRGQAGERQIEGAEIALAHGNGGVFSSQVTAVLGTEATL